MSIGTSCSGEWPIADQRRSSDSKRPPRPRLIIAHPDEMLVPQVR